MSVRYWYFFLMFMPDFIPSIIWLEGLVHEPDEAIHATNVSDMIYYAVLYWLDNMSFAYALFAMITIGVVLYKDKEPAEIQESSWRLPLYFMPLFEGIFYYQNENPTFFIASWPMFSVFIGFWTIIGGYFALILGHAITWSFLQLRLLSD